MKQLATLRCSFCIYDGPLQKGRWPILDTHDVLFFVGAIEKKITKLVNSLSETALLTANLPFSPPADFKGSFIVISTHLCGRCASMALANWALSTPPRCRNRKFTLEQLLFRLLKSKRGRDDHNDHLANCVGEYLSGDSRHLTSIYSTSNRLTIRLLQYSNTDGGAVRSNFVLEVSSSLGDFFFSST